MTFDANGNLTNDGTNTYTWDRANRLISVGSSAYAYDGSGSRIQQTVGANVTRYLLDMQPGLTQVLAATTGGSTDRYVHGLRGIHAMQNNAGAWIWPTQDGLGNVRQELSDELTVNGVRDYEPYLTPLDEQGSFGMPFAATGEMVDVTGQVYLRARYYNPNLGLFSSLDPFEGVRDRAMSLNGYSWVEGNVANAVDPSGRCLQIPSGKFLTYNGTKQSGNCPPRSDGTACEKFVSEVRCIIELSENAINSDPYGKNFSEANKTETILDFLAYHFSGTNIVGVDAPVRFAHNWLLLREGRIPQGGNPATAERYDLPTFESLNIGSFYGTSGADGWRHPFYFRSKNDYWNFNVVNNPDVDWKEVEKARLNYGFKRPFYANTHHYFGLLRTAYNWRSLSWLLSLYHEGQRGKQILDTLQSGLQNGNAEIRTWYNIQFYDTAADLYLDELARNDVNLINTQGIWALPDSLSNWCAASEDEIWSLENTVTSFGRFLVTE